MSRRSYKKDSTGISIQIFIPDSATGVLPKTGLTFSSSGLTAYFSRPGAAAVAITLATLAALTTAWSSGGFKEIDATHMPGWYRLDVPDAALATGVSELVIVVGGGTGVGYGRAEIDLTNQDVGALDDGAITADKLATAALTADKIATDAFGALELSASAASEIAESTFQRILRG